MTINQLRDEIESLIEASKAAKGDSAKRFLNKAECTLNSYEGIPDKFKKTYLALINDLKEDIEQNHPHQ